VVIEVLGEAGELTLNELEQHVGERLGASVLPASVEEFVHELMNIDLITETPDRRRFKLTDGGQLRFSGFRALSKG
jgi:hypothetical protein